MTHARASIWRSLLMPLTMLIAFWTLAVAMYLKMRNPFVLINFGYIGTSVAIGMAVYALLPRAKKIIGRRLAMLLIGIYLLVMVGFLGKENMQLEGFFFTFFAGIAAAATIHYAVAKIVGPILFGRGWCGWACWTVMVLDLLPFTRGAGRLPRHWGWVRYAHFAASLALVSVLYFVAGYALHPAPGTAVDAAMRAAFETRGLYWMLAGNLLYYGVGITLAYRLRDNRAFCKYVCPITVPLKLGARFALFKVAGTREACTGCRACDRACPMDIRIADYIQAGTRVLSTECITCQACLNACPKGILRIGFGLDLGGKELLREK